MLIAGFYKHGSTSHYNVRNLRQRWKVTLLAVFGIGLVVAVFVTLLAMENGFRIALRSTGSPLNAIVTQRGSMSELTSWINIGDANVIAVDPRVARDTDGKPLASCEVVILTTRPRRKDRSAGQHHLPRRHADGIQRPQQRQDRRRPQLHARACTKSSSARRLPTA